MNDTEFHALAISTLAHLAHALEPAFESGSLEDVTLADGILTIVTAQGQRLVVSKHGPSQQIWLASPLSGGLHFSYNPAAAAFALADGRHLSHMLHHDLARLGIEAHR